MVLVKVIDVIEILATKRSCFEPLLFQKSHRSVTSVIRLHHKTLNDMKLVTFAVCVVDRA